MPRVLTPVALTLIAKIAHSRRRVKTVLARCRANAIAAVLRSATTPFSQRIVRNRRLYTRKVKHPARDWA